MSGKEKAGRASEKPIILHDKGKSIKLRPDFTTINRMSGKKSNNNT